MGFFKNLIKPVSKYGFANFSTLKVDMHSHLIPGIDDGAQTLDESVELIKKLYELGYRKLIITPHIQGDFFKNTSHIILSGLEKVKRELKKQNVPIDVSAAAEYLMDDKFKEKYKNGELLTLGKKYVLVELSYFNEHPDYKSFIFDLQIDGYKVILAHPERYSYWFGNFGKYSDLKDRGVFFQLNIISLSGYYSLQVKKVAEKLIDEGMIDFLGTDMHNINYYTALENSLHERYLKKILSSGKILNSTFL